MTDAPAPEQPAAGADQGDSTGAADVVIGRIHGALEQGDGELVRQLVAPLHAADLADVLQRLNPEDREALVVLLRPLIRSDAEVLAHLNEDVREQVLELLEPRDLAHGLAELDSDDALVVLEDLDEEDRARVLAELPAYTRLLVEQGLTFPEYSAGRLMQREFVAVPEFWTVGETIDYMRAAASLPDDFYLIFTVDPANRPTGAALVSRILRSPRPVKLATLVSREIRPIPATMDQEEVAFRFRKYGMVSAPVTDPAGRLVGVITLDDVVDVIDEEAEDDLLKLGGVQEDDLYRAVLDTARLRISWLSVNMLTAFLASAVIALFHGTIDRIVALAVLMPIVAGMGGNAGTQALTVAVRGLATKEIGRSNALRVLSKEVLVGLLNGLFFALVVGLIAGLVFHQPMIGVVIGAALVTNLLIAGLFGLLIPLTLNRLKIDPAVASPIFLTTVTDVVGFFSFLGLATWILL